MAHRPPDALRERFEQTILQHIELKAWRKLQKIEKLERESFQPSDESIWDGSLKRRGNADV